LAFDFVSEAGIDLNDLALPGVAPLLRDVASSLMPPIKLDPVAWGVEHRYISAKEGAIAQQWDPNRTPWIKTVLWHLSDESPTKELVCPKGAQVGFTEAAFVWAGWSFDQDPCTLITMWPTDGFIKRQVKQRVDPFIGSAEPLRKLFGAKQSRSSASTLFQKTSDNGEWIFVSAGSAANIAGIPAVKAMADEIDRAPRDVNNEGDPISLLRGRLSDAGLRAKLFIPSTPTILGSSAVWSEFQNTDMGFMEIPCPHCGGFNMLKWENFAYPKDAFHKIEYICEHCDKGFGEKYKPKLLPEYCFRSTRETHDKTRVGLHVSGFYAPLGSYSWEQCASEYEAAGGREDKLKTFRNLREGFPWRQATDAPAASVLEKNKDPYSLGTLPEERCGVLTFGIDIQKDRLEARVYGWGAGLESWLVWKGVYSRTKPRTAGNDLLQDDKTIEEMRDEISADVLNRWFVRSDGGRLRPEFGLMDINFDTSWAWRLVRAFGGKVGAVRGAGGADEDQGGMRQSVFLVRSKVEREGVKGLLLHKVSSPMAFSEFYRMVVLPRPDAQTGEGSWHGIVHLPQDIDDDELKQLTSDHEIFDTKKKRKVWAKHGPNEGGDCRKYSRASLEARGYVDWKPHHWALRMDAIAADAAARKIIAAAPSRSAPGAPANKRRVKSKLVGG
jgi:phage terminase large subunit GpA-like protein